MFAQFKNRLHTHWQVWRTPTQRKLAGMAIGVGHEATQIHAVQLRLGTDGRLSVQHHAHVTHQPLTATQWGLTGASLAAIAPLLPTPTPSLVLALPNALVQHRYLHLDEAHASPSEQIQAVIQQEVDPATVAIDYVCLDDLRPDSSPLYLLCYTHHDAVDHYQNVVQAQGLSLSCLDVEAFAALNAWSFWLNRYAPAHQDEVLMLIQARPTDLSVSVCQQQRLLHQAHCPLPAALSEDERHQQAGDFCQHCWQRFHATHGSAVTQAYLTGRLSTAADFVEALRQRLSVPLTVAHPILALAASPPLPTDTLEAHAPDLLIPFGLALRALTEEAL